MGLEKQALSRWTAEEDIEIREAIANGQPATPLAQKLKRRLSEVSSRARHLGLSFRKAKGRKEAYRGYKVIGHENGERVFEHVRKIEESIGRRIHRGESVHHINCNKLDNHLDNLHLCKSIKEHRSIHHSLNSLAEKLIPADAIQFNRKDEKYELSPYFQDILDVISVKNKHYTLKAREAWHDAKIVANLCENVQSFVLLRIYWLAFISTIRAVGHILEKRDSYESKEISDMTKELWEKWKIYKDENKIFWKFIREHRNRTLKEYDFDYYEDIDEINLLVKESDRIEVHQISTFMYCPLLSGFYAGEDIRDVMIEALEWWDKQLNDIEKHIKK